MICMSWGPLDLTTDGVPNFLIARGEAEGLVVGTEGLVGASGRSEIIIEEVSIALGWSDLDGTSVGLGLGSKSLAFLEPRRKFGFSFLGQTFPHRVNIFKPHAYGLIDILEIKKEWVRIRENKIPKHTFMEPAKPHPLEGLFR